MNIKNIEYYYDKVKEQFPDLEMWEIDKILKHGFRSFFTLINMGSDIKIKSTRTPFTAYFGNLSSDKEKHSKYYVYKMQKKNHIKFYGNGKDNWDGFYYFGLNSEDYQKFKTKHVLENIPCYLIKEDLFLAKKCQYFFKIQLPRIKGYVRKRNVTFDDSILIAERDGENKIKFING